MRMSWKYSSGWVLLCFFSKQLWNILLITVGGRHRGEPAGFRIKQVFLSMQILLFHKVNLSGGEQPNGVDRTLKFPRNLVSSHIKSDLRVYFQCEECNQEIPRGQRASWHRRTHKYKEPVSFQEKGCSFVSIIKAFFCLRHWFWHQYTLRWPIQRSRWDAT